MLGATVSLIRPTRVDTPYTNWSHGTADCSQLGRLHLFSYVHADSKIVFDHGGPMCNAPGVRNTRGRAWGMHEGPVTTLQAGLAGKECQQPHPAPHPTPSERDSHLRMRRRAPPAPRPDANPLPRKRTPQFLGGQVRPQTNPSCILKNKPDDIRPRG